MTEVRYVLRDLPGIAEIEALFEAAERHPNPLWAPESEQAEKLVPVISRRLFGIDEEDVYYVDDPALSEDENERRNDVWVNALQQVGEAEGKASVELWRKLGWDVAGASGEALWCLGYLEQQMFTVTMGMAGHLPGVAVELDERQENDVEAKLRADIEAFRRTRR